MVKKNSKPKKPKKTKKESKRCGPEDKFPITPEVLKEVESLAGRLTQKRICHYYGISQSTWFKKRKQYPELTISYKKGSSRKEIAVVDRLFNKINEGNLKAIMFYLERFCGRTLGREENKKEKERPIPSKLPTVDPIEASKIYKSIMGGD